MAVVNMQDFPLGGVPGLQRLVITGAIDGVNRVFSVSPAPPTLMWFWNGVLQGEPDDYTYSSGAVTMTLAPAVGHKLAAIGG